MTEKVRTVYCGMETFTQEKYLQRRGKSVIWGSMEQEFPIIRAWREEIPEEWSTGE